ncbi:MAG: hypothetical protein AAGD05_13255, partial [Bacteroidota bacterium]
ELITSDAASAVASLNGQYQTTISDGQSVEVFLEDREMLPKIIRQLVESGIQLYEVSTAKEDLEQMFINLTTK